MLLASFLPRFRAHLEHILFQQHYDYIVPIESKGMLILKEVLDVPFPHYPKILNARAFDFIPPDEMKSKRIAIIDDTVFTGKTLNSVAQQLTDAGASHVDKLAFLLHDTDEYRHWRQSDDINYCSAVSKEEFKLIADDLAELSGGARPSYPDHLTFRIHLSAPVSPLQLLKISSLRGIVAEYRRNTDFFSWSVHWPDWSPEISSGYCQETGLDKVRINASNAAYVDVSPIIFPLLEVQQEYSPKDPLWAELQEILDKPWHDSTALLRNLYESFALSLRLRLVRNFLADLREHKIPVGRVQLHSKNFSSYFGEEVARDVERVSLHAIEPSRCELRASRPPDVFEEDVQALHLLAVANDVVVNLREEYIRVNQPTQNLYNWRSVGRYINELANLTSHPKAMVALVTENLNDRGDLSPLPFDIRSNGTKSIVRTYRLTETATTRLCET